LFDRADARPECSNGTFSRSDFVFDPESNLYVCPAARPCRSPL
jgi:hypothetical protein